jgi:hypothetical protein
MRLSAFSIAMVVVVATTATGSAQSPREKDLAKPGGDAKMMYLPKLGIKGNSHMPMQDRNNLQLADMVIAWIDTHVESKGKH